MGREHHPALGWGAIAAVVVAYDAWAVMTKRETLSSYFHRAATSKPGRILVNGGWIGLSYHLMVGHRLLPERHYAVYRRVHPLWRLHDLASNRVPVVSIQVVEQEFFQAPPA